VVPYSIVSTTRRWKALEGDIFLLGDVLFEDIVLDGAAQLLRRTPCFSATAMYIAR